MEQTKCVYRSFAIPVPSFDILKDFQRDYEERHRVKITNNQALVIILSEHRKLKEESVEHNGSKKRG